MEDHAEHLELLKKPVELPNLERRRLLEIPPRHVLKYSRRVRRVESHDVGPRAAPQSPLLLLAPLSASQSAVPRGPAARGNRSQVAEGSERLEKVLSSCGEQQIEAGG